MNTRAYVKIFYDYKLRHIQVFLIFKESDKYL